MRLDRAFFCEFIRQQKGGQLTVIGLLPTDHVIVAGDDPKAPVAMQLTCLLVFEHMQGVTEFTYQIEVVRGKEAVQTFPPQSATRNEPSHAMHAHAIDLGRIVLPGAGEYAFNFLVKAHGDTLRFMRKLSIRSKGPAAGP